MVVFVNILIWLHLAALVIGMGAGFSSGQVSMRIGTAPAEARETLVAIYKTLTRFGHIGLGLLLITGPIIVWLKYGNYSGFTWWFWLKMALVVVLIVVLFVGARNSRKALAGDQDAIAMAPRLGMASGLTGFAIIFTAVFAFA